MSKQALPLPVRDISSFARSLRRGLDALDRAPGHVEMLNLLAKAGGYRNFQHLKAQEQAREAIAAPQPQTPSPDINYKRIRRCMRMFDERARLMRWPKKHSERLLCLWAVWSRMPVRTTMTEREISDWLAERHVFGDHALLRRWLVDYELVERTADGRAYKRLERRPTDEALELIGALAG